MLLDRWLGGGGLQGFNIGSDVDRLDIRELDNAALLKPREEISGGPVIRQPGVLVTDRGGEEFQKTAHRMIAGTRDCCWRGERTVQRRRRRRRYCFDDGRYVRAIPAHGFTLHVNSNPRIGSSPWIAV
jgi:hypothetical protein